MAARSTVLVGVTTGAAACLVGAYWYLRKKTVNAVVTAKTPKGLFDVSSICDDVNVDTQKRSLQWSVEAALGNQDAEVLKDDSELIEYSAKDKEPLLEFDGNVDFDENTLQQCTQTVQSQTEALEQTETEENSLIPSENVEGEKSESLVVTDQLLHKSQDSVENVLEFDSITVHRNKLENRENMKGVESDECEVVPQREMMQDFEETTTQHENQPQGMQDVEETTTRHENQPQGMQDVAESWDECADVTVSDETLECKSVECELANNQDNDINDSSVPVTCLPECVDTASYLPTEEVEQKQQSTRVDSLEPVENEDAMVTETVKEWGDSVSEEEQSEEATKVEYEDNTVVELKESSSEWGLIMQDQTEPVTEMVVEDDSIEVIEQEPEFNQSLSPEYLPEEMGYYQDMEHGMMGNGSSLLYDSVQYDPVIYTDTSPQMYYNNNTCNVQYGEDMNTSPIVNGSDVYSVTENVSDVSSSDSGASGTNNQQEQTQITYEFEFPTCECGRLIGRLGKNIKHLRQQSGTVIIMKKIPFDKDFQICSITGTQSQLDIALSLIAKKFPKVDITRSASPIGCGSLELQLAIPEDICADVIVTNITTAGHIFVQQPMNPSFASLSNLNAAMAMCYNPPAVTPDIIEPVQVGTICACSRGAWYRCQIVEVNADTNEVDIKYLDYGGYEQVNVRELKKIHTDFMALPFQATECYMAYISPLEDEEYFSQESEIALEEITMSGAPIQIQVVDYADDGIPMVDMYAYPNNKMCYVNRELVDRGLVSWEERPEV
ncbi:uncharacterized protein LOC100368406 [Saccoglossus kowalevskii]|uniref:Midasin-like n=1 Tax=Saccoglossus kowalevskii TaxID=10224 RepID=A0ABM0GK74_SACKO|nr:PREDICTED: midasin-like [Saccoglossus kowalevskii]